MAGEVGEGNIWTLKVRGGGSGQQERQVSFGKIVPGNFPFGSISLRQVNEACGLAKRVQKVAPAGPRQVTQPGPIWIPPASSKILKDIK